MEDAIAFGTFSLDSSSQGLNLVQVLVVIHEFIDTIGLGDGSCLLVDY